MMKRKFKLAATVGLLLLLLASGLEFALRLGGATLTRNSAFRNKVYPEDAGKLRILALGESTTAAVFPEDEYQTWPGLLERGLEAAGVPARVYNEGFVGTTSALILLRLPGHLEKYRPQVVISMVGINDHTALAYAGPASARPASAFSRLRLVKLFALLGQRFRSLRSRRLDFEPLGKEYSSLVHWVVRNAPDRPLADIERELREALPDDRTLALVLSAASVKLRGDKDMSRQYVLAGEYSDRAFDLYPFHQSTAFWALESNLVSSGSPRMLAISRKILECGPNLSDDLLTLLAISIASHPELAADSSNWPKELKVLILTEPPTRGHYRALAETLRERGVAHIAMQYPTLPVDRLKAYFASSDGKIEKNFNGLVFVSNRENFAAALKSRGYDEVFSDRWRGSWGHATPFGHSLIAEAAKTAVLKLREKTGTAGAGDRR